MNEAELGWVRVVVAWCLLASSVALMILKLYADRRK